MSANNFTSIGTTALLILNRLRCEAQLREQVDEKKTDDEKAKPEDQSEKDAEAQRDYINHRLREISAWETRINGGRKP